MTTIRERSIADGTRTCLRMACLFLAGIGMHAEQLVAAPGDLDPGFGAHGRVQLPFDGGLDDWVPGTRPTIVLQSDGRVLVARTDRVGSDLNDSQVAVARLLPDGTLDPEFGVDGIVRLRFSDGDAAGAGGLALLADGRIVVVGYSVKAWVDGGPMSLAPSFDTGVALLRADGSLDPAGPGDGGRITLDLSKTGQSNNALAAVALEDGRIVVAGTADGAGGTRLVMARMTPGGEVDTSFGDQAGLAWAGSYTSFSGFHRTSDGRYLACGTGMAGSMPEGRIARFDSSGELVAEATVAGHLTACVPQQDGSLVVGGYGNEGSWLGQVATNGELDLTFGDDWGLTPIFCSVCSNWDRLGYPFIPTDIAVLADGRLKVALDGYGWGQLAMLSFTPDGRPDPGSASTSADRYYDVGWPNQPPAAGASRLLSTQDGDLLAVAAGRQSTTVMRLNASGGPGSSVVGLQGDFTQQSESDSRGFLVCRSGSTEGAVSVDFATRDDTAQSLVDYVPAAGVVTWVDGEAGCKVIPVTVLVDSLSEPAESIWIELTNAVGAGLSLNQARLNIVDAQSSTPVQEPRQGGGGATGGVLLLLLAALAGRRRLWQRAVVTDDRSPSALP